MNWKLGLDRTVSRLIPTFLRNQRMYQWCRSIVSPLDTINDEFVDFAYVKKRESLMSSQTQILESYLNELYGSYFFNSSDRIQIVHGEEIAQGTFFSNEPVDVPPASDPYLDGHMVVYNDGEDTLDPLKESPFIFYDYEDFGVLPEDFRLILPASIQGNEEAVRGITSTVDKYVIDMKKYDVTYNQ